MRLLIPVGYALAVLLVAAVATGWVDLWPSVLVEHVGRAVTEAGEHWAGYARRIADALRGVVPV